jgi:ubiquinone/menaquinone biosynthesis C-methylase UbiE
MCAGGLSYGDNELVLNEIYRVLKPNGFFICVDSLNENPLYRLNRVIHFLRGDRTISTLHRMPTIGLINAYHRRFGNIKVRYFGSVSWAMPLLGRVFGATNAAIFSRWFDRIVGVRKSAFKFVMSVRKEQQ